MNKPLIGVGVVIINSDGHILLSKRKAKHGNGQYSIPGGKLDIGEKIIQCATREIKEETGLELKDVKFIGVTNNLTTFKQEGLHSVSMICTCDQFFGSAQLLEPDKHQQWIWCDPNNLPSPQFEASEKAVELYLNNELLLLEN